MGSKKAEELWLGVAQEACSYRSRLGESPLWVHSEQCVYWVDIDACTLNALSCQDGSFKSHAFSLPVCAVAQTRSRQLLVALSKKIILFEPHREESLELALIDDTIPTNRCNDGKVDPCGNFWIGSMDTNGKRGCGKLIRLGQNGRLAQILDGLSIPNGMAWSLDLSTMYYIDSPSREIWAFDFDTSSSEITSQRTVISIPGEMGVPDGMAMDMLGRLWVAHWGDGKVRCWDPLTGACVGVVEVGARNTTSCCFGGLNRDVLYITSAMDELGRGGALYRCKMDVPGAPVFLAGF